MGCGKGWFSIGNSEDAALGGSQGPAGPSGMPALAPVGNSCLVPLQLGLCPGFFRQSGASSLPWVCPEPEEPQSPSMPSVSCPAVQQRARTELSSMHGKSCRVWGWQLRIRALWWPREGQSPSIHLAAGRALPRSPQTASGLGCSETTAFFWKDVGDRKSVV